jgi:hypothetical protein
MISASFSPREREEVIRREGAITREGGIKTRVTHGSARPNLRHVPVVASASFAGKRGISRETVLITLVLPIPRYPATLALLALAAGTSLAVAPTRQQRT